MIKYSFKCPNCGFEFDLYGQEFDEKELAELKLCPCGFACEVKVTEIGGRT